VGRGTFVPEPPYRRTAAIAVTTGLTERERRELRRKARSAVVDALTGLGGEGDRDAIVERAVANGGFSARELAAEPPPRAAKKYTRSVDRDLDLALTALSRDGLVDSPARGTWRLASTATPPSASPPSVRAPADPASTDEQRRQHSIPPPSPRSPAGADPTPDSTANVPVPRKPSWLRRLLPR
jgi:hypothetical protein